MNEQKFYTIGCTHCGGIQIGRTQSPLNIEFIPIFRTAMLAELCIADTAKLVNIDPELHPPKVVEMAIRII